VNDPIVILDLFVRGVATGAMTVLALSVARSRVTLQARLTTLALGVSTIAWMVTECGILWRALGRPYLLLAISFPVGGIFWLFIMTVFEDRPIRPFALALAPPALLVVLGFLMNAGPPFGPLWAVFNGLSGLLALHAAVVVARGWRDDLIEGRRRARALVLGLVSLFVLVQVAATFLMRLTGEGAWRLFTINGPFGGAILAILVSAGAVVFLQARPVLFGAARRAEATGDPRADAAERLMLQKLDAAMAAEGWRREGLTIVSLAAEIGAPEHRLRRLINQRLGHRNFADFVNSHRVEAAKRRLADPAEARTTVAAVAFDLGYGSLGPFNRAFRAATGASPTEWRRQALQAASPNLKEAV
jgi:AraC-like DNA-binding protein